MRIPDPLRDAAGAVALLAMACSLLRDRAKLEREIGRMQGYADVLNEYWRQRE